MRVLISEITVEQRKRGLDEADVVRLMDSITIHGLLHPVTVTKSGTGYQLVAGLHRLEACKLLGHQEIEAKIIDGPELQLELAEIEENLIRAELPSLQRADCHARREEILKVLGLVTAHGGDRRSTRQVGDLKSYADQAGEALSISARSVQRDLHRAKNVGPEIRGVLGKEADSLTGAQLDLIAKANPEQQRRAAEEAERAGGSEQERLAAIMEGVRQADERSAGPRVMGDSIQPRPNLDDIKREWLKLDTTGRKQFLIWTKFNAHPDYSDTEIIDVPA